MARCSDGLAPSLKSGHFSWEGKSPKTPWTAVSFCFLNNQYLSPQRIVTDHGQHVEMMVNALTSLLHRGVMETMKMEIVASARVEEIGGCGVKWVLTPGVV
jgi:hypothetical protein